LLWAAVRFGPAGASLSVTALVCISSWCAYAGEGPFLRSSFIDRVTSMQISWIMICAPVLALAAVVRERKFATLALLKSEGRFRKFFETQPESCYMISPRGIVLDINPAACEALGYTKEELIGKAASIIYAPESHSKMRDLLEKWNKTGRLESEEIVVRTRDGQRRVVLVNAGSVVDAEGNLLHSTSVHVDITERKLAEEALSTVSQRLIEAHEEERTRIARELHDDFSQRLALLAIQLGQASQSLPDAEKVLRTRLHAMWERTTELSSDIHKLSHQLHSSKLQHLGLLPAAKSLCEEIGKQHHIHIEFLHRDMPEEISPDMALCFFRIVQEALNNIVKHSGATQAHVEFVGTPSLIRLRIVDAGAGFDPTSMAARGGLGLASMRERLRLLGGTIALQSSPMEGTEIVAEVPIKHARAEAFRMNLNGRDA
jgi:PAS domain S-box-containing protein